MTEPTPERVRVTGPRQVEGRPRRRTGAGEIDAQSDLGEIYMASLLRAQGRLAALVLLALLLIGGGLPLLLVLAPGLTSVSVLGMPLPWVVLAFGIYPVLVTIGWLYVRAAERTERDFTDVVER